MLGCSLEKVRQVKIRHIVNDFPRIRDRFEFPYSCNSVPCTRHPLSSNRAVVMYGHVGQEHSFPQLQFILLVSFISLHFQGVCFFQLKTSAHTVTENLLQNFYEIRKSVILAGFSANCHCGYVLDIGNLHYQTLMMYQTITRPILLNGFAEKLITQINHYCTNKLVENNNLFGR